MAWRRPRSLSEAAAGRVLEGLCQGSQTLQPFGVRGDALYQNAKSKAGFVAQKDWHVRVTAVSSQEMPRFAFPQECL